MPELAEFIGITFALLAVVLVIVFKSPANAWAYLKMQKGITKGIVIVLVVIPLIALVVDKAFATEKRPHPFNTFYVFTGIDFGKKTLSSCHEGDHSNMVSNVGFGGNIYKNGRTEAGLKYTHHSCAFGHDRYSYDALGVEVRYTIPLR